MSKVQEVLEIIKGMTVLELSELVKACEEEFGVTAAAPVAMAAMPAAGASAPAAEAAEEKPSLTSFSPQPATKRLRLSKSSGKSPVWVSKRPRICGRRSQAHQGESLQREAEDIKNKIAEAGGSVEIQ